MFTTLFEHTSTCIRGYQVPPEKNPHRKRMTATLTYLRRHVHHTVVYVVGKEKRDALARVQADAHDFATTPACILKTIADGHLFTSIV
jgi:6-phosphogluconolactonase/glucosamine-6-phosphate isomerase/deaminase